MTLRRSASPASLLLLLLATLASLGSAHTVISYPGSRGNNLHGGNATFPYDMQWLYPCMFPPHALHVFRFWPSHESRSLTMDQTPGGGMAITQNRTNWPLKGGAIAIQPGWFQGHATAFFYINMGYQTEGPGTDPLNMSNPMVPVFQIVGPSRDKYDGTFCLPQVPLPANAPNFKVGDNATIQVVETAVHGAALYNVRIFPRSIFILSRVYLC